MATKFGLAGGIPERRVRPIWDAVDPRQFKAALKLCIALLTKYPNSPYAFTAIKMYKKSLVKKGFCSGQFAASNCREGFLLVHGTMLLLLLIYFKKFLEHGCLLEDDVNWSTPMVPDHKISKSISDIRACHLTDEVFDERISSALSFIQNLQMEVTNDFVRCPCLATIEIERRHRMKGKADDGNFVEVLLDSFHRQ